MSNPYVDLANTIRANPKAFTPKAIQILANFCVEQSKGMISGTRWLEYVAETSGPRGGKVK